MAIYIYLYLSMLLGIFFEKITYKGNRLVKFYFVCIVVIFALVAGTRYRVGVDFFSYMKMFDTINYNVVEERLFVYLVRFLKCYINNLQVFLVISIITMFFLYKVFEENLEKYYIFGFYIYMTSHFFAQNMGQIRFSLSIAICLYSLKYIDKKLTFKNLILLLIIFATAFFIHRTAIIYIFIFFLVKLKNIKKNYLFPMIFCSFVLGKLFITKKTIIFLGNLVNSRKLISMAYGRYVSEVNFSLYQLVILGTAVFLIMYKTKSLKIILMRKMYFFGVGIYFLFINMAIFSGRFSDILLSCNCLLFPLIIKESKDKKLNLCIYIYVLCIGMYIYFSALYKGANILIPYRSWLLL